MCSSPRLSTLTIVLTLLATALTATRAQGQRPSFSGLTLGVDVARHNVIAGALHGGVDILQQQSRVSGTLAIGGRVQFAGSIVAGAEIGGGPLASDMTRSEPALGARVRYEGATQRYVGAQLGHVVGGGHRTLVYAYVAEMTRHFDVTIEGVPAGSSTFPIAYQQDEQGLLRYGIGVERLINEWLSWRGFAGLSRADFGDRPTNIRAERRPEIGLGGVARLRLRAHRRAGA